MRIAGGKQIPLSVQELVDCDTAMNRGCNGGNPLYAFEYTMSNALTSWDDYPYRESVSNSDCSDFIPKLFSDLQNVKLLHSDNCCVNRAKSVRNITHSNAHRHYAFHAP